jgi:hypothetical protein
MIAAAKQALNWQLVTMVKTAFRRPAEDQNALALVTIRSWLISTISPLISISRAIAS